MAEEFLPRHIEQLIEDVLQASRAEARPPAAPRRRGYQYAWHAPLVQHETLLPEEEGSTHDR